MKRLIIYCITLLLFLPVLNGSEMLYVNFSSGETLSFLISEIDQITFSADTSIEDMVLFMRQIPIKFLKNYPNPFNPVTNIMFELNVSGLTKVEIFNIKGQRVKTLVNKELERGSHSVVWDGKNNQEKLVSSGVYFYRVSVNGAQKINKMLMIK